MGFFKKTKITVRIPCLSKYFLTLSNARADKNKDLLLRSYYKTTSQ